MNDNNSSNSPKERYPALRITSLIYRALAYICVIAGVSPESNASLVETPPAKTAEVGGIDLDDNETRNRIIAEAIDGNKIQKRDKEGERLVYAPNKQTPYTGWSKLMYENGRIRMLAQFKDGKPNGLLTAWHENGQKQAEGNLKEDEPVGIVTEWYSTGQKKTEATYKDGKQDGLKTGWYENGQKKREGKLKGGLCVDLWICWYEDGQKESEGNHNHKDGFPHGLWTYWYGNGQKWREKTYKDGKTWSAVVWKHNGEKCPVTKIDKDGDGVEVWYYEDDGTESFRTTYKDGKVVFD